MLGRKFFKTKLCKLYQGGRCPRENCSFAHGNADLRHVPGGFFNDRADFRSGDLRDKLERRTSPPRRYSPRRDARGYHEFHRQKPVSRDRGYSRSRSPVKRSERRHKKSHHSEGESDDSGSLKISSATKYKRKEDKISSQDEKDALGEQLKKTQVEINVLRDHKAELETFLEEKDDEAHKFSSKIEDLEMQLEKEQEEYRRITSKIKKFVRAQGRYVKAQEDLKRSQARLQRLGDNLGSDISKPFANEEDSSVNFASDEEANADKQKSPRNYESQITSSIKKRQHVHAATSEEAHIGNKRKKTIGITNKSEKLSRAEGLPHSESDNKESKSKRAVNSKKDALKSWDEYKHKHGKLNHSGGTSLDKVKGSEVGHSLPSTSMAANAIDELLEAIDIEEKSQGKGASAVDGIGAGENRMSLSYVPPPPPPPPVTQNAYRLFEGDDEDVDVEKVDLENMDVNSEVEIV